MSKEEPFWIYQPIVLFTDFVIDFTQAQTTVQWLNIATRILLLMLPLTWLFNEGIMLFVILLALMIIIVIGAILGRQQKEGLTDCQAPTLENPLMNVQLSDLALRPERPPACPSYQDPTYSQAHQALEHSPGVDKRLFHSPEELWGQQSMERQFYSNPATIIPNDREKFMNWCWNTRNVCKDGDQEECVRYEDPRLPDNEQVFF